MIQKEKKMREKKKKRYQISNVATAAALYIISSKHPSTSNTTKITNYNCENNTFNKYNRYRDRRCK